MLYKISDIANKTKIHPNTVRFYERIGLISAAPRAENRYRIFDDHHMYQVMILRCIFLDDWPGKNIRKASYKIINAMKLWDLKTARRCTEEYIKILETEFQKAIEVVGILKKWGEVVTQDSGKTFKRKEVAVIIGTTPEALRNWERNGLIEIPRISKNKERIYGEKEIQRLKIIYMLRQSKYSMSAIFRYLNKIDNGFNEQALSELHNPHEEDIVWTGDQWHNVLQKTILKAKEILKIIDEIES